MTPFIIAIVFLLIDIALLLLLKKVNFYSYQKKKSDFFKGCVVLTIALFGFCGYMYFMQQYTLLFECQKETMRCTYSRSTQYDKMPKPVKTYDISSIDSADIQQYRRDRHSIGYRVVLRRNNGSFMETPVAFSRNHEDEAIREVERFNRFLFSQEKNYTHIKFPSEKSTENGTFFVAMALIYFALLYSFADIIKGFRSPASDTGKEYDDEPPNKDEDEYQNDAFAHSDSHTQKSDENDNDIIRRTTDV